MLRLGIIVLAITLAIVIPTHDKWSYKAMHDRSLKAQTISFDDEPKINRDRKR